MRSLPPSRALLSTAILCVFAVFLARCASDPPDESCDAGCLAGEVCQDGGCIDEACEGIACPEGQACSGGACIGLEPTSEPPPVEALAVTKRDNGEACISGRDCLSGLCADGVCCNKACGNQCDACDLPGLEGVCTVRPAGASCEDGDACTVTDVCNGVSSAGCAGAARACDRPLSQCHEPVGTCLNGSCAYALRPVGAACNDGNACTSGEACGADQSCGGGAVKVCDAPSGVCFAPLGACLPSTGECAYDFQAAGTECRPATGACDVAEACTGGAGACPADSFSPEGASCPDDGDPCTTDACDGAGGCLHPPAAAGTACGEGSVCDGSAQCVAGCWIGGALWAPGATNPAGACQVCNPSLSTADWSFKAAGTVCRGTAGVCDAAEACTGSSAQCPGDAAAANGTRCGTPSSGSWGACGGFSGTCGESGTQSRSVTEYACFAGACQGSTRTETQGCARETDGSSCGPGRTTDSWSECEGFSGTCGESGEQYREITDYTCVSGSCQGFSDYESRGCSRDTDGISCGATTTQPWSPCSGFSSTCDETGSQARSVTVRLCSAGSCSSSSSLESQTCTRSTTGVLCGINRSEWSTCGGFSGACGRTGTQSRQATSLTCGAGSCVVVSGSTTEYAVCERDTTGASCDDGNACTTGDSCTSSGSCSGTMMSCPGGGTCSNGVCPDTCSGPGRDMCNGVCTDLMENNFHCGICGRRCLTAAGEECMAGECVCTNLTSTSGEDVPRCAPLQSR